MEAQTHTRRLLESLSGHVAVEAWQARVTGHTEAMRLRAEQFVDLTYETAAMILAERGYELKRDK